MLSKKIGDVPVEEDTRIIFRQEASLGKYDVLYEKWSWEGISAESIIFAREEVADMTDEEIEQEVRKSPLVKKESEITVKRLDAGFTFVNFNFETQVRILDSTPVSLGHSRRPAKLLFCFPQTSSL